jgi:hypothetical protein
MCTYRERREVHTEFWWGNLKKKGLLGRRRRKWEDNIKMELRKWKGGHGLD